ncbi:MAG: 50S ribosomal protein L11 methyltransferase [Myxococcaceae bacterium]
MAETYLSLTVELPEDEAELLESTLHDLGALGLEVRDREAPPMPGVRGPNPGEAIVIGFFDEAETARAADAELRESFPKARCRVDEVVNQDWSNSWKALIKSVEVGGLWVGPPWEREKAPEGKLAIVIEPKMAFGTGDHPTTSLCLEAVNTYLQGHPRATVLDVGTGTGVLAIAAKKLGAGRTVGVDNDALSVELAKENAQVNQTLDLELSEKTLDVIDGTFDLVLANILANTLIDLAPLIVPKVKDRLILAGVLAPQRSGVEAAFVKLGLTPAGGAQMNEWVRIELRRA